MKNLIVATFPAAEGKFDELQAALVAALPETGGATSFKVQKSDARPDV